MLASKPLFLKFKHCAKFQKPVGEWHQTLISKINDLSGWNLLLIKNVNTNNIEKQYYMNTKNGGVEVAKFKIRNNE